MRVGYIGLGNMGKPMASHLAPAGFDTTVFDLAQEPMKALVETGAQAAASPIEVAAASDVLCMCVPADKHVRSVLLGEGGAPGALDHLPKGATVAIHSTVTADTILEMSAEASARGCTLIDAPVTGGAARAGTRELVFMVGGESAAVERVRPVLDASSKLVIHAGPLGSGAKLKLGVNALGYIHFAAVRESYTLMKESGVDPKLWIEATRANGQLSDMELTFLAAFDLPEEVLAADAYQDSMKLQLLTAEKDLAHALALARESGISMPTAGLVAQNMARIYGVNDKGRR